METNDVVLVNPDNLQDPSGKGYEILNQSKSIVTTGVELEDLVRIIVQKQRENHEKYASLAQKTVFLVDQSEFDDMIGIMDEKSQE
jgi:hypothetical protein